MAVCTRVAAPRRRPASCCLRSLPAAHRSSEASASNAFDEFESAHELRATITLRDGSTSGQCPELSQRRPRGHSLIASGRRTSEYRRGTNSHARAAWGLQEMSAPHRCALWPGRSRPSPASWSARADCPGCRLVIGGSNSGTRTHLVAERSDQRSVFRGGRPRIQRAGAGAETANRELGTGNGERGNGAALRLPVQQWAAGGANSPGTLSFLAILTKMTHRR